MASAIESPGTETDTGTGRHAMRGPNVRPMPHCDMPAVRDQVKLTAVLDGEWSKQS
jgi:hypothetical protein